MKISRTRAPLSRTLRILGVALLLPLLSHGTRAQTTPSETLTFPAIADVYVDSGTPTTNLNADTRLRAAANLRIAYLRFAVTGVNGRAVRSAKLRLGVVGASTAGGMVHTISNTTWNETAVTWNARPAVDGPVIATLGAVTKGTVIDVDLGTAITADGVYNLAIDSSSIDTASYNSNAATSGQKPALVLTVPSQSLTLTITQPPDGGTYFVGDTATLQGHAVDQTGADVSAGIAWSSSLSGPLGTGTVVPTVLALGSHTVTATVDDGHGHTASAQVHLTVRDRPAGNTEPLVTITAPLATAALNAATPVTFTGTAADLEDGTLNARLAWTSDRDGALGTGGTIAHTLSQGIHQITASVTDSGGARGSATIVLVVQPAQTLEFTPIADTYVDSSAKTTKFGTAPILRVGQSPEKITLLRFTVAGMGSRTVASAVVRLQVDSTKGAESAVGGTIFSISNNIWPETSVNYNLRPIIDGPALSTKGAVALGGTVDFDVTSAITGNGTYNFAITSSSIDGADYRSREGGPSPRLIVTLAGSPPTVTVMSPAANTVVFRGASVTFTGHATDAMDGDLTNQLAWKSSLDGPLGTGAAVGANNLSVGSHIVTASVANQLGFIGEGLVNVRVRLPNVAPAITITAPPSGASVAIGTPVTFQATATDDFDLGLGARVHWTSSRDGALGDGAPLVAPHLSLGSHVVTASVADSDGASASATVSVTVTPAPPTVAITQPASATTTVFAGTPVTLAGTATDPADGNVSASLRWTSDRDGDLGTGASVVASALTIGTHTITASVTNGSALTGHAQRTVVVRGPNVPPTITIQRPASGDVLLSGKPVLLAAVASDPEDGDLGAAVRWTSSRDGALGTGAVRTLPTLSVGSHTLTASVTDRDGATVSASVAVTVSPSTLTVAATADTYVTSATPTKAFGTATTLLACTKPIEQAFFRFPVSGLSGIAVDRALLRLTVGAKSSNASKAGGVVSAISSHDWTEAATTYATRPTIDGPVLGTAGAVKVKKQIDFDVTAAIRGDGTYDFALASTSTDDVGYASRESKTPPQLVITLKQNTPPVIAITAPSSGATSPAGSPVTLTATAVDAESGNLAAQVRWSSSRDGSLGTGASLTLSTLSGGTHTITAQVTDPNGASASTSIILVVGHPPVVAITAPADRTVMFAAALPVTLKATATDVEDGDLGAQVAWTSSLDGALGTGATLGTSALRVGSHTITASVTDATGIRSQASIALRIRAANSAPTITIASPTAGASIGADMAVALAATVTDDFDTNLGPQLRWTSSRDGLLGTGPSLSIHPSEGPHTITATVTDSDGAVGTATVSLTITPTPPVVTITAPVASTVFAERTVTFTATALDATDGDLSSRLAWTSDRDGAIGSGPSFTTAQLSVGTHVIAAAASDNGGLMGRAQLTLVVKPKNTPPVVTITAPADGGAFLAGRALTLTATATDAESGNLGSAIAWRSSIDGPLGTGGGIAPTTLSPGTHVLTASVTDAAGETSTANVTVTLAAPTLTLSTVADTYVDSGSPTKVFGTATQLVATGSPSRTAFLRFTVNGVGSFGVARARLRLTVGSTTTANSASGGSVYLVTDNTWSEAATTYNNRPATSGGVIATTGAVAKNAVVDFDVTSAITGDGTYNFALLSQSNDDVVYQSREATAGRPQLVVDVRDPNAPTLVITAPPVGTTVAGGSSVDFAATAHDVHGTDLSAVVQWSSSIDGFLGAGASISHVLNTGTHTITASVTDGAGATATSTVVVAAVSSSPSNGLGVRDWTYGPGIEIGPASEATAQKPESKLWFVDGLWWGTLYNPTAGAHHIYKFNVGANVWIDTGVLVDERPQSRQDVLWDGSKLYMVSRFSQTPAQNRVLRYSYNAGTKTWSMDDGFPANIPGGGALALTVAKDTTGTLWITYVVDKQVYVSHSVGSDTVWSDPFLLPFAEATALKEDNVHANDISGVIALQGKIGVFWSNQTLAKDFFAVHRDIDGPTTWSLETAGSGGKFADDHFNLKLASDGRLFAMIKTGYNSAGEILDALIVRSPSGTWSPLFNICLFDFNPTRELILLDEEARKIYAFYSFDHAAIYYKVSDMDTIAFPDGPGTPFIADTRVKDINNPTSTKQNVTRASGILVEASSPGDTSYWHNTIVLP